MVLYLIFIKDNEQVETESPPTKAKAKGEDPAMAPDRR